MKNYKRLMIMLAGVFIFIISGCGKTDVEETFTEIAQTSPPVEKRASFFGVGDNLIHNCVYWQADDNAPGDDYDFKPMYENLKEKIKNTDISYINQETILGGTELGLSSYPMFNSPKELGRDMIDLGFDVFSHATNHVFDKGEKGFLNTYEFYKQNPEATMIGLYKKGEENIKIVERNGIKIAFMNYTYHTNGLSAAQNSEFYVPLADIDSGCTEMIKNVKRAKEMADFVVMCIHWGDENQTTANEKQKTAAKLLADSGCDVIIGTHPHSIQPIEFIGDTLVVYSLGNFISAQAKPVNMVGLTVGFDFVLKGDKKAIENVYAIPVINHYNPGMRNIKIIPFDEYSPQLAQSHGVAISYEYLKNLIENTVDFNYLNLNP